MGELVGPQSDNHKQEGGHLHLVRTAVEQTNTQSETDGNTTLPTQHKRTLRRTTLTMTTQLDKEKLEA